MQMPRVAGGLNNFASYHQQQQQYPPHSQAHSGLPAPSLTGSNPSFMNANSMSNPFAQNGNALTLPGGFAGSGLGMSSGTGLASQAAQMSFATANIHNHGHNGMSESSQRGGSANKNRIREVWAGNLDEEMAVLRAVIEKFPYLAMVRRRHNGRRAGLI